MVGHRVRRARDKVVDATTLVAAIAEARADGARIVFTNGCFDLLHVGHLYLIEAARALGDRLVCAVNDDASTRLVKGPGRPLVPFEERACLLAGLEAVDWVVGFAEPTPVALIERLLPDVLVKGDDWSLDAVVGRYAEVVEDALARRAPP